MMEVLKAIPALIVVCALGNCAGDVGSVSLVIVGTVVVVGEIVTGHERGVGQIRCKIVIRLDPSFSFGVVLVGDPRIYDCDNHTRTARLNVPGGFHIDAAVGGSAEMPLKGIVRVVGDHKGGGYEVLLGIFDIGIAAVNLHHFFDGLVGGDSKASELAAFAYGEGGAAVPLVYFANGIFGHSSLEFDNDLARRPFRPFNGSDAVSYTKLLAQTDCSET
jgi:hypothetical protein